MRTFYVWSGTLRGELVVLPDEDEDGPTDAWDAVDAAVRQQIESQGHSVLGPLTRVVHGKPNSDNEVFISPPYEEHFPDLFEDEDLGFTVAGVES